MAYAKLLIPAEVPKESRTTYFVLGNFITTSIKPYVLSYFNQV